MEKKTILAASLAGMFALSIAAGCGKEAAKTVDTDAAAVQTETTVAKDGCQGKDGCSAHATSDVTEKDGCSAKAEKDSCKTKDSCKANEAH